VIARRDFNAILFSRSFFFFLLGPLFPVIVGAMAGGVGARVQESAEPSRLGVAMASADVDAMQNARATLADKLGGSVPELVVVKRLTSGEEFDAAGSLKNGAGGAAAIVSGTPASPQLTGPAEVVGEWQGPVSLIAAQAAGNGPDRYPQVAVNALKSATPSSNRGNQLLTAQAGQTLLFLLTMLLAGMVLSNLVEEKANKIIEILAAAIPMDAVFFGKLFAMLAGSLSWRRVPRCRHCLRQRWAGHCSSALA
jgi:ABC-2 type transport system permease protein